MTKSSMAEKRRRFVSVSSESLSSPRSFSGLRSWRMYSRLPFETARQRTSVPWGRPKRAQALRLTLATSTSRSGSMASMTSLSAMRGMRASGIQWRSPAPFICRRISAFLPGALRKNLPDLGWNLASCSIHDRRISTFMPLIWYEASLGSVGAGGFCWSATRAAGESATCGRLVRSPATRDTLMCSASSSAAARAPGGPGRRDWAMPQAALIATTSVPGESRDVDVGFDVPASSVDPVLSLACRMRVHGGPWLS